MFCVGYLKTNISNRVCNLYILNSIINYNIQFILYICEIYIHYTYIHICIPTIMIKRLQFNMVIKNLTCAIETFRDKNM